MSNPKTTRQKRSGAGAWLLLALSLLASPALCEESVSVSIRENWSAIFGGQPVTYHLTVSTMARSPGRLLWRVAVNGATLKRGEAAVVPTPAQPAHVAVFLNVPDVREGVSMQAVLTASFVPEGESEAAAAVEKTLWIFASDPFAYRKQWLRELDIRLFDPEKKTGPALKQAGIPFKLVATAESLANASGVVVIGEGVSFRDYRALPSLMLQAAAGGANVLCLAPAGGEFRFPGSEVAGEVRPPDAMQFRRGDIIRELDKRLDATAWPQDGVLVASSMKLVGQRGPVVGEIVAGNEGWPWVRLDYRQAGTLMIVGFPIVAKWHSGPSPRYLFASLLEVLAGRSGG